MFRAERYDLIRAIERVNVSYINASSCLRHLQNIHDKEIELARIDINKIVSDLDEIETRLKKYLHKLEEKCHK
jgi:hypothetical protein